ncbi:MAG: hypothetical protein ACREYF_24990 [Gammaproteobacteria bacterium]
MRMKRRGNAYVSPWEPWLDLASTTAEMLGASAYVIGHRTARMAGGGAKPSLHDQREYTRMVQEKFEAAAESAQAMAGGMLALQRQWLRWVMAGLDVADPKRPTSGAGRALSASMKLGSVLARTANKGLRPVQYVRWQTVSD